jgi:glycosyltransferase involved in cell wall biosynthesis
MNKIYFLLPDYPLWFDGANKYQTKIFEYFKSKSKFVYTFGQTLHVKQSGNWLIGKLYKLFHLVGIVCGIFYIIRIPKYSIIIINSSHFFHYFIPLALNKYWKKHIYFLIVHDLVQKERPTFFRKKLENYFILHADRVVTNSKMTKDDLISLGLVSEDTSIIHPGLDVDFSNAFLKRRFSPDFKLLFVGSIEKRKGIVYLLEALARLNNYEFELNLVGLIKEPKYYGLIEKIITEFSLQRKIHFQGRVSDEKLVDYYLNSSLFVFPTLYEGYGMAVAEAMAYGLTIVSTKIPAIEEFVNDRIEGFLVNPGNVDELTESLKKLFENSSLLSVFSDNAVSKARTFLTWDEVSEKYWRIVQYSLL